MKNQSFHPGRRRPWRLGLVALLSIGLLTFGCARPKVADANANDDALGILRVALEAWQAGDTPATLKEKEDIVATDPAWMKGTKLTKFKIDEDHPRPSGYDVVIQAQLWLEDGKKAPQSARFTVSTSPAQVVVRSFGG